MKTSKKIFAFLIAFVMLFSLNVTAFAQEIDSGDGKAAITITNAAKGETYSVYKLFNASVTGEEDGDSIVYTGEIPSILSDYFEVYKGVVVVETEAARTSDGSMSQGLVGALTSWTATAKPVISVESDGSVLEFTGLEYGYYVVTTTQGISGITVTSTNPNATIVDKNSTEPLENLTKTVDDEDVCIGQTVEYTVSFETSNFNGAGEKAKRITSYAIADTLPEFLTDVTVTSITIGGEPYTVNGEVPQFNENNTIVIPWAENGASLWKNGAEVVVTYTAVVTSEAAIDGAGNTNKVTVTWTDETTQTGSESDSVTIYTYAIAIVKVDDKGNNLAGAVFEFPFYVLETPDEDGAYIYAGTEAAEGTTKQITTPADGIITIKGVESGTYTITEAEAPGGYNLLEESFAVTAQKIGETSVYTTFYLDENGDLTEETTEIEIVYENNNFAATAVAVVNISGTLLPTTGGMGTTIFYIIGAALVVGAGVLLVVRHRMKTEKGTN